MSVDREPDTQKQHRIIGKAADDRRNNPQNRVQFRIANDLRIDRRLIARPAHEIAVFRAGRLDRFGQAHASERCGCKLACVAHLDARQVHTLFGNVLGNQQIQDDGHDAHEGEGDAVAQHDHQVEHHHDRIQRQRSGGMHKRPCNRGVRCLALQDIARKTL